MSTHTNIIVAASILVGAALSAVGAAELHPTVEVSSGSVIVNTAISSAVLDGNGVAEAIDLGNGTNLQFGIDKTGGWIETYRY